MGPQEARGTPFAFRLMDILDAESLSRKMSGPAMGLGVREGKWGRQKTPSPSTKQPWLWGEINCYPVIPSGKPSNDSFNYPGFSKTLPQRQPAPLV